jgi:hypothetical protein
MMISTSARVSFLNASDIKYFFSPKKSLTVISKRFYLITKAIRKGDNRNKGSSGSLLTGLRLLQYLG